MVVKRFLGYIAYLKKIIIGRNIDDFITRFVSESI